MLAKGQKAPNFYLKNQYDEWVELASLRGRKVFLFFFSSVDALDNQTHMISYAKQIAWFNQLNVSVIGICESEVTEIYEVSSRYHIPYLLLSDADCKVRKLYDVWNKKITFGTERWITSRTSLLIDEAGWIYKTYKRAHIDTNADEVLQYLQHQHEKAEWRKLSRRKKERIRRENAQKELREQMAEDSLSQDYNDDLISFLKQLSDQNHSH